LIISVCILAKNEADTIGDMLMQISRQTFLKRAAASVHLHVLANGCTDTTVARARKCASLFEGTCAQLFVHAIEQGGKSRTWNKAVHEIADPSTTRYVFIDPDVSLLSSSIIDELLSELARDPSLPVCGGYPIKDVHAKQRKTYFDRFTLAISARAKPVGVINGSLYAMRAEVAREIWLPNDVPGEDGFLNAMVTTRGFTTPIGQHVVKTAEDPTHSFKAHSSSEFFAHEQRMIVGTVINRWIFEYLWSLQLEKPAGELIRRWNEEDPDWVETIIRTRTQGRMWSIPSEITFGRFSANERSWVRRVAYLPIATLATALTIPPALVANRKLKQRGAAQFW
jgi:glycosyltransferase involved in cell wall biosynthesis